MIQDVTKTEGRCYARDDTWEEVRGSYVCSYTLPTTSLWSHFEKELQTTQPWKYHWYVIISICYKFLVLYLVFPFYY